MRITWVVLTICGCILCWGASGRLRSRADAPAAGAVTTVKMTNVGGTNRFDPAEVSIKVGDQVKWVNEGGSHTATSDDIKTGDPKTTFNTGTVKKGQDASITFNTAGTNNYHCEFHKGMVGKITVQ
jgi:plastocyanin